MQSIVKYRAPPVERRSGHVRGPVGLASVGALAAVFAAPASAERGGAAAPVVEILDGVGAGALV
jgi:hypothetical protein